MNDQQAVKRTHQAYIQQHDTMTIAVHFYWSSLQDTFCNEVDWFTTMSLMAAGKKIALTIHSLNMVYLAMSST
jgi:hypothetical protein